MGPKMKAVVEAHPMLRDVECGVTVEDGWADIIAALCVKIEAYCKAEGMPLPVVGQVKEKFGGLRFYVDSYFAPIARLISEAERESEKTCEVCGAPGELREGSWVRALCGKHEAAVWRAGRPPGEGG